ncbi:substrate-binding periplasmic protein [Grimontia hollisae]|uniref:Bacterial extracellular solute-binding proteins, family 3 n=1 Tax=Grimontia hollisae TaxID=673 RepID=A0A377J7Q9_GRIHO|nr:transporter substrate-binding domain-containing protein [Grimontia hollisae]MDF2184761.1 transporter substrate-binding domain-containing protein [Grimontia hollisae]STO98339.1 Bacterial extracellular solute-binding proteins, family 3 [Grimontia hollisae]
MSVKDSLFYLVCPPKIQVITLAVLSLMLSNQAVALSLDYLVIQDQSEPLQIQEDGTNHRGIVTDVIRQALNGSEYQLDIYTYPFNRFIAELNKKKQGNWITYGSPAWGGMQAANLSETPLLDVSHSILSHSGTGFSYRTPEDLQGKIVVLLFGFHYPGLNKYIKKGAVSDVRVKNYDSAFRVVDRLKDVGGFIEMDLRLKYHLKRLGFTHGEYILHPIDNLIPTYSIHLAYSPGIDPALKRFVDARLVQMRNSGELAEIIGKYL